MDRRHFLLLGLVAFSALSLALKESYPFSHFPMYGNPSDDVCYHWLADDQGKPLPVATLTGKTAPKLGKIIKSQGDKRAEELKLSRKKLPKVEQDAIYAELLRYLRLQASTLNQTLPAKLTLMRTDVQYEDGKLQEKATAVYAE
jgi:hypothetical protein